MVVPASLCRAVMESSDSSTTAPIGEDDLASMRRDRAAADALIDRHLPYVYNLALRATGRRDDAMAVSRDAIVQALESYDWSQGSDSAPLRTTLARNIAQLAAARRPEIGANERVSGLPELAGSDPGEPGRDIHAPVRAANLRLTPNERITLALRDYGGADDSEIGVVRGVPTSRVPALIEGARLALSSALEPNRPDPRSMPGCREPAGTVTAFVDETVSANRSAQIRTHLTGCARCDATRFAVVDARKRYRDWPPAPVPPELGGMVRTAAKEHDLLGLVVPAGPDDIMAARGPRHEEAVVRSPWLPVRIGVLAGLLGLLIWAAFAERDRPFTPTTTTTDGSAQGPDTPKRGKKQLRATITPNRSPKRVPGVATVVTTPGSGSGVLGGVAGGLGALGSAKVGVATIVGGGSGSSGSSGGSAVGNLQVVPRSGSTSGGSSSGGSGGSGGSGSGGSSTTIFDGTSGSGGSRSTLASGGSGTNSQRGVLVVEEVGSGSGATSGSTTGPGAGSSITRGTSTDLQIGVGGGSGTTVVGGSQLPGAQLGVVGVPANARVSFEPITRTGPTTTPTTTTPTTTAPTTTVPSATPAPPGATTTGSGVWVWCPGCYVPR
jgi:DNA-directed RNA polymerase specialized sigma24 family protein